MGIDLHAALSVATAAARSAGAIIRRGYDESLDVVVKGDASDRVTQVDLAAQLAIAEELRGAFPAISLLGEEDTEPFVPAPLYWVVDPLDGTSNFIQRLPQVGVSIGLRQGERFVLGVIYAPVTDDLYTAVEGGGAYRNGNPIRVRQRATLAESTVAEIFSDRQCRGREVGYPPALVYRKFGTAVTSVAYLAQGSVDAVGLQCRLWDIAAAEVIAREAGARVEWAFTQGDDLRGAIDFVAATPGIFDEFAIVARTEFSRWNAD